MQVLTISNFEKHVGEVILQRGKQYYDKGYVTCIEETDDTTWMGEVEGSETYSVTISLKKNNEISDYYCDCPYDGDICKHVVAVLFTLRNQLADQASKSGKVSEKILLKLF